MDSFYTTPPKTFIDVSVLSLVLILTIWFTIRKRRHTLPLPPGPRKLPVLGSFLDIPTSFEWETFQRWGKEYNSDIVHCSAPGSSLIILNSIKAANDLLDKRSANYSGRPSFTLIDRVMQLGWMMPFMPYGVKWRERRRFFQRHLNPSCATLHKPLSIQCSRRLLVNLLDTPDDFLNHVRHCIGALLRTIAYGTKTDTINDPYITLAEEVIQNLADAAIPVSMIFDAAPSLIPILRPFMSRLGVVPFNKTWKEWEDLATQFRDAPFRKVKRLMIDGTAEPSLVTQGLEDTNKRSPDIEDIIKDTAGIVFVGGSGTTTVILQSLILALMAFPEVQQKAQRELDAVVGQGRLPEFTDEPQLPYLSALLKEVQRWRPAGPLAIPHRAEKADVYNGYFIPAHSIVMANVWAILHNEEDYPDPASFNPDRFLKNGVIDPSVRDPVTVAFGFGRRICPGIHIALSSLWITAATIIHVFSFTKPLDENGNIIEPSMEYHSAITFAPVPFKCSIKPRSDALEGLIRDAEN